MKIMKKDVQTEFLVSLLLYSWHLFFFFFLCKLFLVASLVVTPGLSSCAT